MFGPPVGRTKLSAERLQHTLGRDEHDACRDFQHGVAAFVPVAEELTRPGSVQRLAPHAIVFRGCASCRVRLTTPRLVVCLGDRSIVVGCARNDAHPWHCWKRSTFVMARPSFFPGKLALALVARDAAAEGRARLREPSGNRSRDRSSDERGSGASSPAGQQRRGGARRSGAELSRAEHEVG